MELPKINQNERLVDKAISELETNLMKTINDFTCENDLGIAFIVIECALNKVMSNMLKEEKSQLIEKKNLGGKK